MIDYDEDSHLTLGGLHSSVLEDPQQARGETKEVCAQPRASAVALWLRAHCVSSICLLLAYLLVLCRMKRTPSRSTRPKRDRESFPLTQLTSCMHTASLLRGAVVVVAAACAQEPLRRGERGQQRNLLFR